MTPATATSTRVSLSGRRSRSGSPPSTKKYGESVLSSGARSAPDGGCAEAASGTSKAQRRKIRSQRVESVMRTSRASTLPGVAEQRSEKTGLFWPRSHFLNGPTSVREFTSVWARTRVEKFARVADFPDGRRLNLDTRTVLARSEEHTSELQSQSN